ncbi:zinc finger protein 830 [Microdochium nivale]|nr:zinc finger protein 830 [Microdochium nivale]
MADARALLRAHRSENRIKHPHAAYSDAGKLLCKLCHESIRSESLWDAHARSTSHQAKLQAQQQQQADSNPPKGKRKLDHVDNDDGDEDMQDAAVDDNTTTAQAAKRSKTDGGQEESTHSGAQRALPLQSTHGAAGLTIMTTREKTKSPPIPTRRASNNTPIQGVEIAIPSRPATPLARSDSATSTPNMAISSSRSPLASIEGGDGSAAAAGPTSTETQLQLPSHGGGVPSRAASVSSTAVQPPTPAGELVAPVPSTTTTTSATILTAVDESEWAAFEAELASADEPQPPTAGAAPSLPYADATISAPAMTKAELEARSQEEINESRKQLLDAQIAGEKEDATRALEDEFDEMEELEGRVKRLKERRELLRRGSVAATNPDKSSSETKSIAAVGLGGGKVAAASGKENGAVEDEDQDDDDDDDDGDDEWDGFRFRA